MPLAPPRSPSPSHGQRRPLALQVRIAQRAIPTGLVYAQNEKTLIGVGAKSLQKMLATRDWDGLREHHVDRKTNDLFDAARSLVDQYAKTGVETLPFIPTAEREGAAQAVQVAPADPTAAVVGCPQMDAMELDLESMIEMMEMLEEGRVGGL